MRRIAIAICLAAMLVSSTALADPTAEAPAYSYEIENAPPAGKVIVVWPRACAASGEPLGNVDLTLNPDWTSRMNDVDYEVIVTGKTHVLLEPCMSTARLYALSTDVFPLGARAATGDDVSIGQAEAGVEFSILPALDGIDRKRRIELFEKDSRVLRSAFRFETEKAARAGARAGAPPVESVHEVLAVDGFDATAFRVRKVRVSYTDHGGGRERVEEDANASANADASANASASASADAAGEEHDLGTRWVLLAALGGLLAGGLLAHSNKKRGLK